MKISIDYYLATKELKRDFTYEIQQDKNIVESNILMLNINKAKKLLNWKPKWSAKNAILKTLEFEEAIVREKDLSQFALQQINEYLES